ncbi:hypothetical protein [Lysobacter gummosus]
MRSVSKRGFATAFRCWRNDACSQARKRCPHCVYCRASGLRTARRLYVG